MKSDILIVILSIFMVLIFGLFIFNYHESSILGSAIEDIEQNQINISEITEDMAVNSLKDSRQIIEEMKSKNFSVIYMEDIFLEANRTFEQVKYAEILQGKINASERQISEARKVLSLVNWKDIGYKNVLIHTDKIKARKIQAFFVYDSLSAAKISIEDYEIKKIDVSEASNLLDEAEIAFYDGGYESSKRLLEMVNENLELKSLESATFVSLQRGTKNFFQRYWIFIILFLISGGVTGFFIYKNISLRILKKRINKLNIEKKILVGLMKKTQIERFRENKISNLVYNIRMKKYNEKLNKIKQELPVFENKLSSKNSFNFLKNKLNIS